MADGAQRLLDVIDDPNALESFLGGLTSASDLLESAESVDTVVASLAQSLAADYEVDSPNETLFDTFEASSANLTDISQSYVPSDFDNAGANIVYGLSNGLPSSSSSGLSHSAEQLNTAHGSGQAQTFEANAHTGELLNSIGPSATSTASSSSANINVESLVSSNLGQQFHTSVCDSNNFLSTVGTEQQQQQEAPSSTPIISSSSTPASQTSLSFSQLSNVLHTQHQQQVNAHQVNVSNPSLSSSSSNNIVSSSSSGNAVISTEGFTTFTATSTATSSSPLISVHNVVSSSSSSLTGSSLVTSAAGIGTISIQQRQQQLQQLHLQQSSAQQVQQPSLVSQNQQLQQQILSSQSSQLVQQQGLISQNTQIVQQQQQQQQVQQSQLLQQQIQQLQANQLQQQPLQQQTVQQLQQSIQQITQLQQQNQLPQTQITQQHILQGQLSTINAVSSQSNTICNVVSSATNSTPTIVNTSTSGANIQVHQPSVSQPSYIVTSTGQTVSQIAVQQQQQQQAHTVSLPSMTVGSLTTPSTGLVSNVISGAQGTNVMHIQSGAQGQQFITLDAQQTPTLIATAGGATFGGGNLVLTATPGGTPTYAVLPSTQQIFANAIVQPGLQALKNSSGQTFFQTANGSIVAAATNTIQGLQNFNVQGIRAKTQPQILPKPVSAGVATTAAATVTAADGQSGSTVTTTEQQQTQATQQGQVGQIIQSGQIQVPNPTVGAGIVTSVSNGGVTFSQPSFTFNSAGGIGQVMVSGVGGATQQAHQLAGTATIVLNQFGQPMLLPTGGANQNNGLQFILRQQPAQQAQVLTIQTPQGTATTTATQAATQGSTANVKQVVRYVPQLTQNQTVQIQQIQTPNGPAYIAVRCPPTSQPSAGTQFVGQVTNATTTMQTATAEIQQQVPTPAPAAAVVTPSAPRPPAPQVSTNQAVSSSSTSTGPTMINTLQQQTLASLTQKTKQQITIKAERVTEPSRNFNTGNQSKPSATSSSAENSSRLTPSPITTTPKKKKPSKKKKVTLDLDEILKQSGIGDEDLQDDSCFENIPNMSMQNDASSNGYQYNAGSQSAASAPPMQTQSTVKPNGSLNKSNSDLPVNILSPHVHVLQPTTHLPKGGRSNNNKNGSNASPVGAGSSSKKTMPKKSPAKRKTSDVSIDEPPSKISTTYQVNNKPVNNMSPKFTPSPAFNKSPNNSSKNVAKKNSPKMAQNNNNNSINNNNYNSNVTNSPVTNANKKKPSPKRPPVTPKGGPAKNVPVKRPMVSAPVTPTPSPQPTAPAALSTTPVNSSVGTPVNGSTSGTQRVVHTIQLTPQNQQLLRNIQVQINRLMSLPKRNDTEQTALQKLIFLQQQVIATGTPVSNPAGNLSGSVTTGATTIITNAPSVPNSSAATTTSNPNAATIPTLSTANSNNSNSISNPVPAQRSIKTSATTFGGPVNTSSSTSAVSTASANLRANSSVVASTPNGANNCSGQNIPNSVNAYVANITAQNNLVIKNEKTDVTDSFAPDQGANNKVGSGPSQGYPAGSTVVVLDDPKIAEQRRAAAKAEEEARAKWRKEQFDFLLKRDQEFFVEPDYKTPFTSKEDAVERLMKYHLGRDRTEMDFDDFDEEFSETAVRLLDKFAAMVAKYKYLMLKESMKETSCAERVMVERMFCNEEKVKLEQDKLLVAQGEILELPSPPESWVPRLQEMVEADMKELELDSTVNLQVQSAIDSIISCGTEETSSYVPDDSEKIEYDAFGVPTTSSSSYGAMGSSSSADIDEAVRSILA